MFCFLGVSAVFALGSLSNFSNFFCSDRLMIRTDEFILDLTELYEHIYSYIVVIEILPFLHLSCLTPLSNSQFKYRAM